MSIGVWGRHLQQCQSSRHLQYSLFHRSRQAGFGMVMFLLMTGDLQHPYPHLFFFYQPEQDICQGGVRDTSMTSCPLHTPHKTVYSLQSPGAQQVWSKPLFLSSTMSRRAGVSTECLMQVSTKANHPAYAHRIDWAIPLGSHLEHGKYR